VLKFVILIQVIFIKKSLTKYEGRMTQILSIFVYFLYVMMAAQFDRIILVCLRDDGRTIWSNHMSM